MCEACYQAHWKRENPERFKARPRRMADCHPDRPVIARDLCGTCYRRLRRREPEYQERERAYHRESQREKRAKQTPRERYERVLRRYGLTFVSFSELVLLQEGRCAACLTPTADLEVDHCHERGLRHVRGLLCHPCNSALGHAREDADRLIALVAYLRATAA